jgi:uncharacterized membrane protein YphA (DoxX/SURF4 family)
MGASTSQNQRHILWKADRILTTWMADHGILLLRISLGVIYLWFGALKFFPELSPAEELATHTISKLSMGLIPPSLSLPLLAVWECLIGLGLLSGLFLRGVLFLLAVQMVGTISPIFIFPEEVFVRVPFAPTLEGQYIIKNLVIISAAIVIGATVRGGRMIADPEIAEKASQEERVRLEEADDTR